MTIVRSQSDGFLRDFELTEEEKRFAFYEYLNEYIIQDIHFLRGEYKLPEKFKFQDAISLFIYNINHDENFWDAYWADLEAAIQEEIENEAKSDDVP